MTDGVNVGTAYLEIIPSAKGFAGKMQAEVAGDVARSGEDAGKKYSSGVMKGAGKLAAGLGALFAVDKVKDFLGASIDEARESQKVSALTAQVIKTTGGAANVSAKQVGSLATAISNKVGVDDEAIQSGENLLLTFKNVRNETGKGNDIFNQASKTSVDLAASLAAANGGQMNLKTSTTLLGKALNDPVKGLSALSRVGVTFTAQQQKQIKALVESGDSMKAQKIILGELKSEFGGAAASQATAGQKAGVAWKNLQEQIGGFLLPLLDKAETTLSTKVIPAVSRFFTEFQKGTGTAGQIRTVLTLVFNTLVSLGKFLREHKELVIAAALAWFLWKSTLTVMTVVQAAQLVYLKLMTVGTIENTIATKAAAIGSKLWAAAQWLLNAALTANPIGLVVVAIAALVAAFIIAYKKSDTFRAIVQKALHVVLVAAQAVGHFFADVLPALFSAAWSKIIGAASAVGNFFVSLWQKVKAVTVAGANAVVNFVRSIPGRLLRVLMVLVKLYTLPYRLAAQAALAVMKASSGYIVGVVERIPAGLMRLAGKFGAVGRYLIQSFVNGLKTVGGIATGIAGNVWNVLKSLIDHAIDQINSALEFNISVGFGKHISVNPPDIPHLANGGIVKARPGGTLALLGEAGRDEAVIPLGGSGGGASRRTRAVIVLDDGRELGAYIDDRVSALAGL